MGCLVTYLKINIGHVSALVYTGAGGKEREREREVGRQNHRALATKLIF